VNFGTHSAEEVLCEKNRPVQDRSPKLTEFKLGIQSPVFSFNYMNLETSQCVC